MPAIFFFKLLARDNLKEYRSVVCEVRLLLWLLLSLSLSLSQVARSEEEQHRRVERAGVY